jgi:TRAP transporter TAXI family solute receptor
MNLLVRTAIVAGALTFAWSTQAAEPDWPDTLTIGAGSPGGTYHIYGAGLARILSRNLDLPVVMRPTEGPAENIVLLEAGEAKVGFVTVGVALQAWNGTGLWAGKAPARSLRAIFPMYDTPFQFLALQDTNIRSDGQDRRIRA